MYFFAIVGYHGNFVYPAVAWIPIRVSVNLGIHVTVMGLNNFGVNRETHIIKEVRGFRLTQHWFEYFIQ
jgi:hypothetical protein